MGKIKGWKKIGNYKSSISWKNNKGQLLAVSVRDYKRDYYAVKLDGYVLTELPTFVSAKTYATNYMRSHPNG